MTRSRYRRRTRGITSRAKRRILFATANSGFQHANRELRFEPLEHRWLLAADITTGLAGHWKLEETAIGQTVFDASGLGNNGVHVNLSAPDGPSTNAAVGSSSLSIDGVDGEEVHSTTALAGRTPYPTQQVDIGRVDNNSDLTDLELIRTDAVVAFDWAGGSPDPAIGSNTFSVRWTGQVEPLYTETYSFHATTNDGVRMWVDGQQIVDRWVDQSATRATGTIDLLAGNRYDIVMEYYDNFGDASAILEWSSATQALAVIPQSQLYDGSQTGAIISFAANVTNVDESAGTAQVTVLRLGDTSGTSSVQYATSEDTATAGSDYADVSGVLNFAVDETSKTISIPISDDSDLESTETIDITLSNPTGAILGTQS